MADSVRNIMEQMIPELRDYERRGYFNRDEIAKIVQRREQFEYRLRRRAALKDDFLRYCDYEQELETLRQSRQVDRVEQREMSIGDFGITRRIHFILERASNKFPGDLGIWTRWLEFCKHTNSKRKASRVMARALNLHPNVPFLWTYAAAWEFEANQDPTAARKLMQNGIRNCPKHAALWTEYVRMELLYAHRLMNRHDALGLDVKHIASGAAEPAAGKEGGPAGEGGVDKPGVDSMASAQLAILEGELVRIVYDQACRALSEDVAMRQRMLQLVTAIEWTGKAGLAAHILGDLEAKAGQDTTGHSVVAVADAIRLGHAHALGNGPADACAYLVSKATPTAPLEMHLMAARYLRDWLESSAGATHSSAAPDSASAAAAKPGVAAHESVVSEALLRVSDPRELKPQEGPNGDGAEKGSDSLYAEIAELHLQEQLRRGSLSAAQLALDAALERSPVNHLLWKQRLEVTALQARHEMEGGQAADMCIAAVRAALHAVQVREHRAELLAPALCVLLAAGTKDLAPVVDAAAELVLQPGTGVIADRIGELYMALWHHPGCQSAELLARKVEMRHVPGAAYWTARLCTLCMECNTGPHTGGGQKPAAVVSEEVVRATFERAVTGAGSHAPALWTQWLVFERQRGGTGGSVLQRALKTLPPHLAEQVENAARGMDAK